MRERRRKTPASSRAARIDGVAAEILQTKPFASPGQEAAVGLLRTSDQLRRFLARAVGPRGITLQQYNVLRILRGAGDTGLPTLEIAGRMIEAAPGITRLLDRLERKKLIVRWRCAEDRRQVLCRIAPAGRDLLRDLASVLDRAEGAFWKGVSAAEVRRLTKLLDAVRRAHRA